MTDVTGSKTVSGRTLAIARFVPPLAAAIALVLALAAALPACRSRSSSASPGLSVAGGVDFAGTSGYDLAIDPALRVVYLAGGFGQSGIARVDVSDPTRMSSATFTSDFGGGVGVDLDTHLVASTDANTSEIGVFEPSGATFDARAIRGCGGSVRGGGGRFLASTQCLDTFSVYDETARAVPFAVMAGGTGSNVVFNAATGRWYANRTPRANNNGVPNAMVVSPTAGTYVDADMPIDGVVVAADAARNRVWIYEAEPAGAPSPLTALDGWTHAALGAAPLTTTAGALAISGGLMVHSGADGWLRLFDAGTGALLDALDFAAATGGYSSTAPITPVVADDDHAYLVGTRAGAPPRLFAIGLRR
jgi:hypothetical protein